MVCLHPFDATRRDLRVRVRHQIVMKRAPLAGLRVLVHADLPISRDPTAPFRFDVTQTTRLAGTAAPTPLRVSGSEPVRAGNRAESHAKQALRALSHFRKCESERKQGAIPLDFAHRRKAGRAGPHPRRRRPDGHAGVPRHDQRSLGPASRGDTGSRLWTRRRRRRGDAAVGWNEIWCPGRESNPHEVAFKGF